MLEIKKFHGDLLNWRGFFDQYKSAIHDKTDVTDIDKFNYLRFLICDEANETIAGLTLSAANYFQAIELLKERYRNKQLLINT